MFQACVGDYVLVEVSNTNPINKKNPHTHNITRTDASIL